VLLSLSTAGQPPARLQLIIHYLTPSSDPRISLRLPPPPLPSPSYPSPPARASLHLLHALHTHHLDFFVTPLQPLHPVAFLGSHHNRHECEHQPQPGEGSIFKRSQAYSTRRHAEETSPYESRSLSRIYLYPLCNYQRKLHLLSLAATGSQFSHTRIATQMLLAHHHTPLGGWEKEELRNI